MQLLPIDRVRPYAGNPRRNDAAVPKVAASIRAFGWRQPLVVDEDHVILAGHTRLAAARLLGLATVPVHVATGLTPAQRRAYRLADNRAGQDATWDDELLGQELAGLLADGVELGPTGFESDEIERLIAAAETGLADGADPDDTPPLPAEPVTRPGDLIQLGPHQVLCGDSTDPATLARLMGTDRAEVLWTDPPYGVAYVGKTKDALTIANDTGDIRAFLGRALAACDPVLAPGARYYVACPAGQRGTDFRLALSDAGWTLHQTLVWVKDALVLGHSDYHYRHEDLLYGWKPGPGRVGRGKHPGTKWYGDHAQDSVFEVPRPKASAEHPTMKPVALIQRCLRNSARRGDLILDPFGGSGSTLLAAESLGLVARLVELAPAYVDVIVTRWEQATGRRAIRPERP